MVRPPILKRGYQKPSKSIVELTMKYADDSFMSGFQTDEKLPGHDEFHLHLNTLVALKCKNVEPHSDEWMGADDILNHWAIFWLVQTRAPWIYIQVGDAYERLKLGDYVVFQDSVTHCVVSDRVWRGIAYQAHL